MYISIYIYILRGGHCKIQAKSIDTKKVLFFPTDFYEGKTNQKIKSGGIIIFNNDGNLMHQKIYEPGVTHQ